MPKEINYEGHFRKLKEKYDASIKSQIKAWKGSEGKSTGILLPGITGLEPRATLEEAKKLPIWEADPVKSLEIRFIEGMLDRLSWLKIKLIKGRGALFDRPGEIQEFLGKYSFDESTLDSKIELAEFLEGFLKKEKDALFSELKR